MKKFKAFVAVLLCLAAVFCTAGCAANKKSALNISGAQIDYETFLYYYDRVHAFPEKYGLASDATNVQMIDSAANMSRSTRKSSSSDSRSLPRRSAPRQTISRICGTFSQATMKSSACRSRRS